MISDGPPSHIKLASASNFLTLADSDPSSNQCATCFHFQRGKCSFGLPLALNRESDVCGWWSTW